MLEPELLELLLVCGQAEAAGSRQRIAGEQLEAVQVLRGQEPVLPSSLAAERLAGDVVPHGPAPEREAAVASARAARDRTGLVEANAEPGLGQRERAGAAGDAAADHLDVGSPIERSPGERLGRSLRQPPRDRL